MKRISYDRPHLIKVLIEHQRMSIESCRCGWGKYAEHLGKSHAAHVADVYEREREL